MILIPKPNAVVVPDERAKADSWDSEASGPRGAQTRKSPLHPIQAVRMEGVAEITIPIPKLACSVANPTKTLLPESESESESADATSTTMLMTITNLHVVDAPSSTLPSLPSEATGPTMAAPERMTVTAGLTIAAAALTMPEDVTTGTDPTMDPDGETMTIHTIAEVLGEEDTIDTRTTDGGIAMMTGGTVTETAEDRSGAAGLEDWAARTGRRRLEPCSWLMDCQSSRRREPSLCRSNCSRDEEGSGRW
jgi:hypothetical protein